MVMDLPEADWMLTFYRNVEPFGGITLKGHTIYALVINPVGAWQTPFFMNKTNPVNMATFYILFTFLCNVKKSL